MAGSGPPSKGERKDLAYLMDGRQWEFWEERL